MLHSYFVGTESFTSPTAWLHSTDQPQSQQLARILDYAIKDTMFLPNERQALGIRIRNKLDSWIYEGNTQSMKASTFNMFFKALNELEMDSTMALYHSYYLFMIEELVLKPNIRTFNLMLKGVRLSHPPRYKFIPWILEEMRRFEVEYDECTLNEILSLCARHPTADNIIAAKVWFNELYVKPRINNTKLQKVQNVNILNSFLNVFVRAGDERTAKLIAANIRKSNAWNSRMTNTVKKLRTLSSKSTEKQTKPNADDTLQTSNPMVNQADVVPVALPTPLLDYYLPSQKLARS